MSIISLVLIAEPIMFDRINILGFTQLELVPV